MTKENRLSLVRGITRIDAPYLIGIILLMLGMSILDKPNSGIVPLMIQSGVLINEYGLLVALVGVLVMSFRKSSVAVLFPLVMVPYIFYNYWYFHLQPPTPINSTITTFILHFFLMIFMMRSMAIYYRRLAVDHPSTYLESFIDQLAKIPGHALAALVMILLGVIIDARPVSGVIQFATENGIDVRVFSRWIILFGLIRLGDYRSAWDVWLTLPLVFYCIFTFFYVLGMSPETKNPILAVLYASLFIFTLRANLSGRG